MALRFIVVDDPGEVTVGQVQEAARLIGAVLAIIMEEGTPTSIVRTDELPADADDTDSIEPYVERLGRLQLVAGISEADSLDTIAFDAEYAVIMYQETPFLVPAVTHLSTEDDVLRLLAKAELTTIGPDSRLPGEPGPLPPDERICFCEAGHQIVNPPDLTCPYDGLPLTC